MEQTRGMNSAIDNETMYTTWVAHNRNAKAASSALGMSHATLRWHVSNKNWQARWEAEFNGAAEGIRKMAFIQAMSQVPVMIQVLVDVAQHSDSDIAKVAAVREFFRMLPPPPKVAEETYQNVVDVSGSIMDADIVDTETAIRNELESNIIEAAESRGRRR